MKILEHAQLGYPIGTYVSYFNGNGPIFDLQHKEIIGFSQCAYYDRPGYCVGCPTDGTGYVLRGVERDKGVVCIQPALGHSWECRKDDYEDT